MGSRILRTGGVRFSVYTSGLSAYASLLSAIVANWNALIGYQEKWKIEQKRGLLPIVLHQKSNSITEALADAPFVCLTGAADVEPGRILILITYPYN
jgi:hypothetical protein